MPIWRRNGWIFRIEGIYRVVNGRDDHDIVSAFTRKIHISHDQRLRIDLIIDRPSEQKAELVGVHVADVEHCLLEVHPGSAIIIVLSKHGHQW